MSTPLPLALLGISNRIGHILHCICGPDATHDLLLMEVRYRNGRWWLGGYDDGDIGEWMELDAATVTEWVEA